MFGLRCIRLVYSLFHLRYDHLSGCDRCLFLTGPDINVKLGLSRIHILDVKPYNSFGIRCAARTTFPTTKTFLWQQSSGGIDTELNHDGTNVNITDNDSNEHTSTSHLQRTLTTAGIYSYMCTVMTDGGLNKSDSIYVNIRGELISFFCTIIFFSSFQEPLIQYNLPMSDQLFCPHSQ